MGMKKLNRAALLDFYSDSEMGDFAGAVTLRKIYSLFWRHSVAYGEKFLMM